MKSLSVILHDIVTDGLPDMHKLTNRVAFIWDGNIISGWPLLDEDPSGSVWEGNSDFALPTMFGGVKQWVEFPARLFELAPA